MLQTNAPCEQASVQCSFFLAGAEPKLRPPIHSSYSSHHVCGEKHAVAENELIISRCISGSDLKQYPAMGAQPEPWGCQHTIITVLKCCPFGTTADGVLGWASALNKPACQQGNCVPQCLRLEHSYAGKARCQRLPTSAGHVILQSSHITVVPSSD